MKILDHFHDVVQSCPFDERITIVTWHNKEVNHSLLPSKTIGKNILDPAFIPAFHYSYPPPPWDVLSSPNARTFKTDWLRMFRLTVRLTGVLYVLWGSRKVWSWGNSWIWLPVPIMPQSLESVNLPIMRATEESDPHILWPPQFTRNRWTQQRHHHITFPWDTSHPNNVLCCMPKNNRVVRNITNGI